MKIKIQFSDKFKRELKKLPKEAKIQLEKKLDYFMLDLSYPSLRIKKIKGSFFWEMSVNMDIRITFEKEENYFFFRRIGTHEILKNP